MELTELTSYAEEKYQIREEHKWADFPGFSVLCHPRTGKWAALLIRQWDTESGAQIEHCDLKCGPLTSTEQRDPCLSAPVRMHGGNWVGVRFGRNTDPETVFRLFDRAIRLGEPRGATVVLDSREIIFRGMPLSGGQKPQGTVFQETLIPRRPAGQPGRVHPEMAVPRRPMGQPGRVNPETAVPRRPAEQPGRVYSETPVPAPSAPVKSLPEKLRQLTCFFSVRSRNMKERARDLYVQGRFMEHYEDSAPWTGSFSCYFPTYQDMTTRQLRGYFSWRADVRRGVFRPISTSAAYLYVYELLNGIGADSPEDSLRKLRDFEKGYLESGVGDRIMTENLNYWMMELSLVRNLPKETVLEYAVPEFLEKDRALAVLKKPETRSDEELFQALCLLGEDRPAKSKAVLKQPEKGKRLFCRAYRLAAADSGEHIPGGTPYKARSQSKQPEGPVFFTCCFGEPVTRRWHPLGNALFFERAPSKDAEYQLEETRRFFCRKGVWYTEGLESLYFSRKLFQGFLRETDLLLRQHLKTGGYLRKKAEDEWADRFIQQAIGEERQAEEEAAKPRITIDLSGLDRIRADAEITRDRLLTEEETELPGSEFSAFPERTGTSGTTGAELSAFPGEAAAAEEAASKTGFSHAPVTEKTTAGSAPAAAVKTAADSAPAFVPAAAVSTAADSAPAFVPAAAVNTAVDSAAPALPLDEVQLALVRSLLREEPVEELLRANRIMPSIAADSINEALFDEFGDTVLLCEDDRLSVMEDYREDLERLLND